MALPSRCGIPAILAVIILIAISDKFHAEEGIKL
jgi:hypothetical protein